MERQYVVTCNVPGVIEFSQQNWVDPSPLTGVWVSQRTHTVDVRVEKDATP